MTRRNDPPIPFWFGIIAMVVLCFATSTCRGQSLDTSGWRASVAHCSTAESAGSSAVVQVTVVGRGGTSLLGSGTLICLPDGTDGYVLSAAHIFRGGTDEIRICDGNQCTPGQLLGVETTDDLALIRVPGFQGRGGVPIAETNPPIGARLQLWGWGNSTEKLRGHTGQCLAYDSFCEHISGGAIKVSVPVRDGDSGGPIINSSGQIVGVIACSDTRSTNGSVCSRIRAFLQSLFPRLAARPPPGRRIGPPAGTVPRGPVLPGPAPAVIGPWAADKPTPGAIPIPKPGDSDGLVPVVPAEKDPEKPDDELAALAGQMRSLDRQIQALGKTWLDKAAVEGIVREWLDVGPPDPSAVVDPELASPIVGPEPAIATNPLIEKKSGIPWASLLGLAIPVAAGAAGVGLPVWAVWAYRGVRVARRLRKEKESERGSVVAEGPFPDGETAMPRDMREVTELLQLSQLEGRSSLRDAVVGMFTFDILDHAIESGSAEAGYAKDLKRRLLDRLNEVAPLAV